MYFLPAVTLLILCTFPAGSIGCHDQQCRVSQWSAWSSCTNDCHGWQTRTRHVIEYCHGDCPYDLWQSRSCHCHHDNDDSHHGGSSDKKDADDDDDKDEKKDSDSEGLHVGQIAGICFGCLAGCSVCGYVIYNAVKRLKQDKKTHPEPCPVCGGICTRGGVSYPNVTHHAYHFNGNPCIRINLPPNQRLNCPGCYANRPEPPEYNSWLEHSQTTIPRVDC